jgi:hypothetical protein
MKAFLFFLLVATAPSAFAFPFGKKTEKPGPRGYWRCSFEGWGKYCFFSLGKPPRFIECREKFMTGKSDWHASREDAYEEASARCDELSRIPCDFTGCWQQR